MSDLIPSWSPPPDRQQLTIPDEWKYRRGRSRIIRDMQLREAQVVANAAVERVGIQATLMLAEYGIMGVAHLKRLQRHVEQSNVDAADAVALIVDQAVISIAWRISRFGQGNW